MEQAKYWMSAKRKHDMILSNNHSTYGDSWEEQAFAEDAAGALGGCVWPPRSYTCSFCRREFRSAQALGGHMNVHRRDRARMKQSPPSNNPSGHDHQVFVPPPLTHHHHNSHLQYPSQIHTFMYKPNPDSDSGAQIRVSSQRTLATHHHSSFSSIVQEENKNKLSSPPSSWSNSVADKYSSLSNVKNDEEKKLKSIDFKKDQESNLEVMIDSVFRAKQDHIEETATCKRRRVEETNSISLANLFPKTSSSIERCRPQSEALERIPSAIEELDLELRL
ncbi:hypothetical protein CQW23_21234 [Capsicum baccatum]|uniref:C2H2-type domain-containing protein n=1 Tax=Capsicum baccatum TaxID=33114 RepID=A0A2G2VXG9_CAPBA|nr:hypothetical protein CQW23_21234 [Capsicum baccatum]